MQRNGVRGKGFGAGHSKNTLRSSETTELEAYSSSSTEPVLKKTLEDKTRLKPMKSNWTPKLLNEIIKLRKLVDDSIFAVFHKSQAFW